MLHHWLVPVLSALTWWSMLALLFGLWATEGFPNYAANSKPDQQVLYISDIGARKFQPIFIAGSVTQGVFFVASLMLEVHLRQIGRLRRHFHWWSTWCLWLSLLFAIVGQVGITFVAVFDTQSHPEAHVSMLVVYIVFIGISALLNVAAAAALERSYLNKRHVKLSLWFKVVWLVTEFVLAIAFVATQAFWINVPAILEWTVSIVYPLYQLIMAWDLWPAMGKSKGHYPKYNDTYPHLGSNSKPDTRRTDFYGPADVDIYQGTIEKESRISLPFHTIPDHVRWHS